MSNSNTNLQTQSSNALHNAIMEAGSKDRPPMLAPVAEAEAVQIIITGIDNDSTPQVDACLNACEMWKAIERNRGKAIVTSSAPTYDPEPTTVTEDDEMSKDKEIDKLMALISLKKHAINLERDLQIVKEKIKNDKSFKENQSNVFLKEREQYFEIQDLKAQLQDKGIAISELKKLIEKMKGKSVETKFEKSSVIRQPNAFKSQRQSILGKPTIFSDSLAKKDFSKSKTVTKQNVSNDFSKPVTAQILPQDMLPIVKNTNVIAPGMYKVHTKPNQTRTPQLHQDIRKPNKRVSFSTGLIPNTSVSRPKL
ncbi:hypothetical protein Tco_0661405 [Tanacetum coccineum]